jgi:hypothetical protein
MTTREMVARLANFYRTGGPHVVWHWPMHYYLAARREYLKIVGAAPDGGTSEEEDSNKVEIYPGVTVEHVQRT